MLRTIWASGRDYRWEGEEPPGSLICYPLPLLSPSFWFSHCGLSGELGILCLPRSTVLPSPSAPWPRRPGFINCISQAPGLAAGWDQPAGKGLAAGRVGGREGVVCWPGAGELSGWLWGGRGLARLESRNNPTLLFRGYSLKFALLSCPFFSMTPPPQPISPNPAHTFTKCIKHRVPCFPPGSLSQSKWPVSGREWFRCGSGIVTSRHPCLGSVTSQWWRGPSPAQSQVDCELSRCLPHRDFKHLKTH